MFRKHEPVCSETKKRHNKNTRKKTPKKKTQKKTHRVAVEAGEDAIVPGRVPAGVKGEVADEDDPRFPHIVEGLRLRGGGKVGEVVRL